MKKNIYIKQEDEIYIDKDRRRGEEKKIKECRPGVFGKNKSRSHFCGIPRETPGDGCPSRGPLRGDNLKGKHVQGTLFARTKDRYFRRG